MQWRNGRTELENEALDGNGAESSTAMRRELAESLVATEAATDDAEMMTGSRSGDATSETTSRRVEEAWTCP
ncbi:hypothetical protein E2562_034106 [Oryza meyeriana var. granulata]|uniref:Uncharacterized protein n=1 Tax=Oryza meyeriana var. granulata TaxID=110450 RepID=A0A6G1E6S1_9ORYZ|nr:hypothetical protein E2562_034106 [Oryza meyeriana var. granulata]